MKYGFLIASVCLTACLHGATRQSAVPETPDTATVERTVSGGRWQSSASRAGNYRVTIRRDGSEETRRYAVLEWVEDGDSGAVVGLPVKLNTFGNVYALSDPVITRRGANWILQLRAATAPLTDYSSSVEFVLGDPGTVTLVRSASPTVESQHTATQ